MLQPSIVDPPYSTIMKAWTKCRDFTFRSFFSFLSIDFVTAHVRPETSYAAARWQHHQLLNFQDNVCLEVLNYLQTPVTFLKMYDPPEQPINSHQSFRQISQFT
jgi:hypothetical protein